MSTTLTTSPTGSSPASPHGDEPSAVDRAHAILHDRILSGHYVPGDMLSEGRLASELAMSRTPVRTAIARLQDDGWVTIYPKRGALVQGMSERAMRDLIEAQFIIETTAVQRSCRDDWSRLVALLRQNIASQREALQVLGLHAFIDLAVSFHRIFVEAGCNEIVLEFSDRLADRQRYLLFRYGERLLERCGTIIREHEQMTDALERGDAADFTETLERHLSETYGPPAA